MTQREDWEFRFKACAAVTAVATAISIVVGGGVALYTYREQVQTAENLKRKEIRMLEYNQKREVYFELVDSAATVASSVNKADAEKNSARFYALYFGKAHIAVVEDAVYTAKKKFSRALQAALAAGKWPNDDLDMPALNLSKACSVALNARKVIDDSSVVAQNEPLSMK